MDYQSRLLKSIPGGAHTYSRGYDQFPNNAPPILSHGKGVNVFDLNGRAFLDYGMALRAVNVGYAEAAIDAAAIEQIYKGNNLTRPSLVELEAAELLISLVDSVEMVKFTKTGSSAVSAAVKLARAYTGKDLVARCAQHPFFSYDDWFISSTEITRGIPTEESAYVKQFDYNDIESLTSLIEEFPEKFACVILEPATVECPRLQSRNTDSCCSKSPCSRDYCLQKTNFLTQVQDLCKKNNIVFILDEMITGFRWDLGGAQKMYGVSPDLTTFGKAMANGYSVSCVGGRRELMELGSIEFENRERVFLLSTTHGGEMAGLGAFMATINFMQEFRVVDHLWDYGASLIELMNNVAHEHGVEKYFKAGGIACSPYYATFDGEMKPSLAFRTLFSQEMIKSGVLMPWIALAYRHDESSLERTRIALERALKVYKQAIDSGIDTYLEGPSIKPVFRKFN